jgi:hypothetical protein
MSSWIFVVIVHWPLIMTTTCFCSYSFLLKGDIIIISSQCNLFSPWYGWIITHLALSNNHWLTQIAQNLIKVCSNESRKATYDRSDPIHHQNQNISHWPVENKPLLSSVQSEWVSDCCLMPSAMNYYYKNPAGHGNLLLCNYKVDISINSLKNNLFSP